MSPFMQDRFAATYARIILRTATLNEIAENSVVDGTQVPLNGDGRRVLECGTVMIWDGAPYASKVRPIPTSPAAGTDEVQTLIRSATPDAGSWAVLVPGYGQTPTTADVTAATLQTNIRALHADLNATTVALVSQTYTITFIDRDVLPLSVPVNTLTASAVPVTIAQATTTEGGLLSGQIAGIVMHTTEFWPDTTVADKDDAPMGLYTKNCHFASDQLIGYAGNNIAIIKAAMTGAGNGRCANCTFEP